MLSPDQLTVRLAEAPVPGLRKAISSGLTEHMHSIRPDLEFDWKPFEIPVYASSSGGFTSDIPPSDNDTTSSSEAAKPVAGVAGHVLMKNVYVEVLWVDPSQRKAGIGRALMTKVEELARAEGLRTVFVDTLTFQAPEFYCKLGYQELYRARAFGEDGIERMYFKKDV